MPLLLASSNESRLSDLPLFSCSSILRCSMQVGARTGDLDSSVNKRLELVQFLGHIHAPNVCIPNGLTLLTEGF